MEDLVKKAKAGDSVAFSELIVLVRADLYRAAFSILRNDADSQDAVQETIIKIYYNLFYVPKPIFDFFRVHDIHLLGVGNHPANLQKLFR